MIQRDEVLNILLVDDQRIVAEAIRRMLQDQQDMQLTYVSDPDQALSEARKVKPAVILQDLVMPGAHGLDLLAKYRADDICAKIPLIVLSSKEEASTKADAFATGANDYLVKLPDRIELVARIRYHAAAYQAQCQRDEAYKTLAHEMGEAADYVRSQLPSPMVNPPVLASWAFCPSMALGGDALGYFMLDESRLVFFLLDVCGHGIGAALLSVTAMNAMANRTIAADLGSPADVMRALNEHFAMERHNNLYFTLWYGVLDLSTRNLRYSVAGHPPAVVVSQQGVRELKASGLPVGIMSDAPYEERQAHIDHESLLYVFSDGAYEITPSKGGDYLFSDFLRELASPVEDFHSHPETLMERMRILQGGNNFEDDVSILLLKV